MERSKISYFFAVENDGFRPDVLETSKVRKLSVNKHLESFFISCCAKFILSLNLIYPCEAGEVGQLK